MVFVKDTWNYFVIGKREITNDGKHFLTKKQLKKYGTTMKYIDENIENIFKNDNEIYDNNRCKIYCDNEAIQKYVEVTGETKYLEMIEEEYIFEYYFVYTSIVTQTKNELHLLMIEINVDELIITNEKIKNKMISFFPILKMDIIYNLDMNNKEKRVKNSITYMKKGEKKICLGILACGIIYDFTNNTIEKINDNCELLRWNNI